MNASKTPRVDAFVATLPAVLLVGDVSKLDLARQVRQLMVAWGTFARELELELSEKENAK